MYTVNNTPFESFKEAVGFANSFKAEVYEAATGKRRWAPASPVSKSRMRFYREQKAAYEAQEKARQ